VASIKDCGRNGPSGVVPTNGTIVWSSDATESYPGWEICWPPTSCECETVIVAGAEDTQLSLMGTFVQLSITTPDVRSVYQNSNSQFLYSWTESFDWQIGPDYTRAASGLRSFSSDFAVCPTGASDWAAWDGATWVPTTSSRKITVTCAPPPPQSPPPPFQSPSPLPPPLSESQPS
jgi:hypothetical protein